MILETLLPQLEFQSNIEDAVKQKMIKSRLQVEEIAATAYSSNDFDFLLCKRMPLTRLVVVVYLLTQKYAEYKAVGVTDEIILDTLAMSHCGQTCTINSMAELAFLKMMLFGFATL